MAGGRENGHGEESEGKHSSSNAHLEQREEHHASSSHLSQPSTSKLRRRHPHSASTKLAKQSLKDAVSDYTTKFQLFLSLHSEIQHAKRLHGHDGHGHDGHGHGSHGGHGEGHHNPHHHPGELHVEITHRELFFDLIFVVANIDISYFMSANLGVERLWFSLLIFLNFWLEWSHVNIVLSTTKLVQPWSNLLVLVVVGAIGLASNLVNKRDSGAPVGLISTFRGSSAIFLLLPRIAFAIIFGNIALGSIIYPNRRWRLPRSLVFFTAFVTSIALCVTMYISDNEQVSLACWITINLVEVMAQIVADVIVPHRYHWKVAPAYTIERNTIWIFLTVGEAIISLSLDGDNTTFHYFSVVILGVVNVYFVTVIYRMAQPKHLDILVHALHGSAVRSLLSKFTTFFMSAGLMCFGVGIKKALDSSPATYDRSYAWLLVGGLTGAYVWLALSQFTFFNQVRPESAAIYQVDYDYRLGNYRRWTIWCLQIVAAFAMLPTATLVSTEYSVITGEVTGGITPTQLFGILLCHTFLQMALTKLGGSTAIEKELAKRMRAGIPLLRPMPHDESTGAASAPGKHHASQHHTHGNNGLASSSSVGNGEYIAVAASHSYPTADGLAPAHPIGTSGIVIMESSPDDHDGRSRGGVAETADGVRPHASTSSSHDFVRSQSLASEDVHGEMVLLHYRSGKMLWEILRDHVNTWRYTQRVARILAGAVSHELQYTGESRMHSVDRSLVASRLSLHHLPSSSNEPHEIIVDGRNGAKEGVHFIDDSRYATRTPSADHSAYRAASFSGALSGSVMRRQSMPVQRASHLSAIASHAGPATSDGLSRAVSIEDVAIVPRPSFKHYSSAPTRVPESRGMTSANSAATSTTTAPAATTTNTNTTSATSTLGGSSSNRDSAPSQGERRAGEEEGVEESLI